MCYLVSWFGFWCLVVVVMLFGCLLAWFGWWVFDLVAFGWFCFDYWICFVWFVVVVMVDCC